MVVRQNIFLKLLNYYPLSFCFWPHFSLCLIFCSLTAYWGTFWLFSCETLLNVH